MSTGGSERTRAYAYALIGAVGGGCIPVLSKFLLRNNGPIPIAGFAFLLSGLMLLPAPPRSRPPTGALRFGLVFGLLGVIAAFPLYTYGLSETTAVNASLLTNAEVLFTTVIAFSVFGERIGRKQATRGMLIIVGLVIVSTNLDIVHVQFLEGLGGNLLVLAASLCWGVENNLMAIATRTYDPSALSMLRNLTGGALMSAFVILAGVSYSFSLFDLGILILLALATTGATYLFVKAIKKLGAIKMLLVWSTSTLWAAAFAIIFLGEQISLGQVAGGGLILLGVLLLQRAEVQPKTPSQEGFT